MRQPIKLPQQTIAIIESNWIFDVVEQYWLSHKLQQWIRVVHQKSDAAIVIVIEDNSLIATYYQDYSDDESYDHAPFVLTKETDQLNHFIEKHSQAEQEANHA